MQSPTHLAATLLRSAARGIAVAAVDRLATRDDALLLQLPRTFADPVDDTCMRVRMLAEAIDVDRPELLAHQMAWYKVALLHRGVSLEYLLHNLEAIGEVCDEQLPAECLDDVRRHLRTGRQRTVLAPDDLPSHLAGGGPLRDEARHFLLAVLENRRDDAFAIIRNARLAGASIDDLHDHVLATVQREVGRMWAMAEIPIADEHFASRIVESCLDRLASDAVREPANGRTVLSFTVGGDLHGIGVRMVADRFERRGWTVWNLGADLPGSDLEWMLSERKVDLIALGATLLLHVGAARDTLAGLRRELGASCPPILVGGGVFAVVDDLYRVVGADAVANSAAQAVAVGERLCLGPAG